MFQAKCNKGPPLTLPAESYGLKAWPSLSLEDGGPLPMLLLFTPPSQPRTPKKARSGVAPQYKPQVRSAAGEPLVIKQACPWGLRADHGEDTPYQSSSSQFG